MRQKYYFPSSGGGRHPIVGNDSPVSGERGAALGVVAAALTIGIVAGIALWARPTAQEGVHAPASRGPGDPPPHPVTIVVDPVEPRVFTGTFDATGESITVRCGTCHATKPPNAGLRTAADLDVFHQGLEYRHGDLSCLACHDGSDYDRLKSASGEPIAFADRQVLCAQCHGPTARDYEHGAHGGMLGHFDLTRGPRTRLGCTQCHDPHSPAYPKMSRTFYSIDRFAEDHHDRR